MTKHLSLLSVLHYVYGILVCIIGFGALFFLGAGALISSEVVQAGDAPPDWVGRYIASFGMGLFLLMEAWGVAIILSGYWISRRTNRTWSIVVAALCLLSVPLGTALGVFTLVVLSSDEVRAAYGIPGVVPGAGMPSS